MGGCVKDLDDSLGDKSTPYTSMTLPYVVPFRADQEFEGGTPLRQRGMTKIRIVAHGTGQEG